MTGGKQRKLIALLSSGTFIMCDVFSVIISAKECQTDVRTKIGTILLCSFVCVVSFFMEFHITDISYSISSSAQCTHVLTRCWRVLASSE